MKKYELLNHRADVKIMVLGQKKEELFLNSLLAMAEVQGGDFLKEKIQKKIQIQSVDLDALLVDFLSEALYLSQTEKAIFKDVNFKNFSDRKLEGILFGQKVERFREDIKAITYSGLKIKKRKDGFFEATLVFDI